MNGTQTLSPKEKKRLERFSQNITILSRRSNLSSTYKFILRQQLRIVLQMLGADRGDQKLRAEALDILRDLWPFKLRRLRKLIQNGRRQQ